MKKTFAQILRDSEIARNAKLAAKLPHWSELSLEYPGKLCIEQCSSEETALYKANIIRNTQTGGTQPIRIADLTGGIGADSWAFAGIAEELFYNERNPDLRGAVERNFNKLGISNVTFNNYDISAEDTQWADALYAFRPNWIYLDPARRGAAGEKVFRVEDCQPDILSLLPILSAVTPNIMVKLSPMADINDLQLRLGKHLKEIRIVESAGEVKELLCIFDSQDHSEAILKAVCGSEELSFYANEEKASIALYCEPKPEEYLFEPRPSLLKAGAFKTVCDRFSIRKLAPSTHLYSGLKPVESAFFKSFSILEILPLGKANILALGKKYPHADVSARNIHMRSEELRSRMKIKPGDPQGIHIFGCTCGSQKVLVVGKRI